MIQHKFEKIISRACAYYEHRHPKDETMDVWAERVRKIPDEAADYIEQHITDNEQFPKNMPNLMWALYHAWQAANPDKVARKEYFFCPDCIEGLIWAKKPAESGRKYQYVFRCCQCKQNRVQQYPKAYRQDLISQGYEITAPVEENEPTERAKEYLKSVLADVPF